MWDPGSSGPEFELSVAADGTIAIGVACTDSPRAVVLSEPELSGDPKLLVLSEMSDEVELAGRATVPREKLMMPRMEARRRVVEGIVMA